MALLPPAVSAAELVAERLAVEPVVQASTAAPASAVLLAPPALRTTPALESLHPKLWRPRQITPGHEGALGTGFAALDAELPGGGWPPRTLTELLLPRPGIGEVRLLVPALTSLAAAQRPVMFFNPPACLNTWALVALGVDASQLVAVRGREAPREQAQRRIGRPTFDPSGRPLRPAALPGLPPAADVLWAAEHALRSGRIGAALLWLGEPLRAELLRRLQLAAQAHTGPVFLLRHLQALAHPSPAPLRLLLRPTSSMSGSELSVRVFKRCGPAAVRAVQLDLTATQQSAVEPIVPRSMAGPPARALVQQPEFSAAEIHACTKLLLAEEGRWRGLQYLRRLSPELAHA
jgi:protein ImuA